MGEHSIVISSTGADMGNTRVKNLAAPAIAGDALSKGARLGKGDLEFSANKLLLGAGPGANPAEIIPGSLAATCVVVANNAKAEIRAWATILKNAGYPVWVCDGTADDVEIQAAIDAVPQYGKVLCLGTSFYLSTKLTIDKAMTLEMDSYVHCANCSFLEITHATNSVVKYVRVKVHLVVLDSGTGDLFELRKASQCRFDVNIALLFSHFIRYIPEAQEATTYYGGNIFLVNEFYAGDYAYYIPAEPTNVYIEGDIVIISCCHPTTIGVKILGGGYLTWIGSIHPGSGGVNIDDISTRVGNNYIVPFYNSSANLKISSKSTYIDLNTKFSDVKERTFFHHDGATFDAWSMSTTGSGAVVQTILETGIATGTTLGSTAQQYLTNPSWQLVLSQPSYEYIFKGQRSADVDKCEIWLVVTQEGIGYPTPNGAKVGFKILGNNVYGHCANGTAYTETGSILSWTPYQYATLSFKKVSSVFKFYVNGEEKAEISANLPSSNQARFMLAIKNTDAVNRLITITNIVMVN